MSKWIEKLDEFVERQGIKSAELCKIIDGVEAELAQQKALLEDAAKVIEFYGDPEHWLIRKTNCWEQSSPRSYLDEEIILSYKHPYSDWVGTIKPGGKRARAFLEKVKILGKEEGENNGN